MLKILIVDDEAFFRTSFTSYIDWASLDCQVVGTAEDGQQALRAVEELHPDLIFLDIRMPVFDGLTVLEHLHETHPEIRVIMLTSFNDFESVRIALRAGAVDYIHKVELGEQNIAGIIEKQKRQLRNQTQKREELNADRVDPRLMLMAWMYRGSALPFSGEQTLREYLGFPRDVLYVMQFSLKRFSAIRDRYKEKEKLLYQGIENMLREMLARSRCPLPLFFEGGAFSLIGSLSCRVSSAEQGKELAYVKEKVCGGLRRFFNVEAVACVSAPHASALELPQMAREAQTAAILAFALQGDGLFAFEQLAQKRIVEYLDTQQVREEIKYALYRADFAKCDQALELLFLPEAGTIYTPNAVRMAAQSILHAFCPEQSRAFWQGQIAKTERQEEVKALLMEFLHEHARQMYPYSDLTTNAIVYIEQNYQDHALSLTQIAEVVNVNASYLSRLFRKEVGCTVTDQINCVRIRAAKQLLRDKRWTVYRVAQEVGYGNTEYFNRIFKKIAGCSPGSYRMRSERPERE